MQCINFSKNSVCLLFYRNLKEFDPDELAESGLSQSWAQTIPDNGPGTNFMLVYF